MAGNYGANQYKQMQVKTASKGQVLLMLYEAAIKHSKKIIECMETKNLTKKGEHIGKAHDILAELSNTLDHSVGAPVSHDLERLYSFMIEQMVKANIDNNPEPIRNNVKMLENLLSAWRVAVDQHQKSQAIGGGKPSATG